MTAFKVIGLLLLALSLCSTKRSHHHKHRLKKNETEGAVKSMVMKKPGLPMNGTKKQSLGMPFNNLDQQGLGGEPVGHIREAEGDVEGLPLGMGAGAEPLPLSKGKDSPGHVHDASEGVGGLGGDVDGVPIGMGAGAEPLGMSKGKEPQGMDDHGGAMQGINEEGEGMRGTEDLTRPFNEEAGGPVEFDGGHGAKDMMGGQSNSFMPGSEDNSPMHMMSSSHVGNSMGNFMGGGGGGGSEETEGMQMGGGGGGGGGEGGNFMGQSDDDSSFRGPKRDPLGGELKPFNDEFKQDRHGNRLMNDAGNGRMSHGAGMNNFTPMPEGNDHIGDSVNQQFSHVRHHTAEDLPQGLNGNLAGVEKVNIKDDNEMGGHSKLANTKNTVAHRKRPRSKNLQ